ncbi:McrC family protein [Amycolatopsis rhizosphaerae]|uniref:McrC family protein n=1 Tax=Amycolatopsis rhizosphaerae TaxID=2053003 RepID=UPI001FE5C63C|nr:McrC family protein [Amycolatopsis rhizosphaerae]
MALDDVTGRALARSRLLDIAPDPEVAGNWRVRAGNKVGVAAVHMPDGSSVILRIAPKVPIARLLFLLGFSRSPKGWRSEHVQVDSDEDLLPAFARLFAMEADEALRQGLLKGYRTTDETALVVRGRIRLGDQLSRRYGQLIPLEITHDEYTTDIAENQLLRAACEALLRLPGRLPPDVRGVLLRLRVRLAEASPLTRGGRLPVWRPSRLNARYQVALRLAELVLHGCSVEHRSGDVTVQGFLFDMAKVFEDFVTTALREEFAHGDGYCVLQATHYLDDRNAIRLIPDFVRYDRAGTPLAVADAKYKAQKPEGFPDADLYQMLAYCTALNLAEGHLVYAKGNAPHGAHRVRHAGITIHQHALDLELPPPALLGQVGDIADHLAAAVR